MGLLTLLTGIDSKGQSIRIFGGREGSRSPPCSCRDGSCHGGPGLRQQRRQFSRDDEAREAMTTMSILKSKKEASVQERTEVVCHSSQLPRTTITIRRKLLESTQFVAPPI